MSDLLPTPRPRPQWETRDPARTLDALATIVFVVLTIAILYLAREILVPIAIAILLSFVLSPFVKLLRNLGLGKTLAVISVVVATFVVAIGLGAVFATQISDLASDAPKYQATVLQKMQGIQSFIGNNPMLAKINGVIADVAKVNPRSDVEKPKAPTAASPPKDEPEPNPDKKPSGPMPVEIVSPAPGALTILQTALGMAASPIATATFVAIFIVFILMQREDLRNRFIRLVGSGDLQRTTLAMNDAARRLSRYFLAQVLLNTGFGTAIAIALAIIGVPGALLWGIVTIFMRFIPYVGSIGAALFPLVMAAAAGAGWTMAIETIILFAVAEFVVGQVVEPLIYGRNTGISPIAVVASATFWTWLWGPIGLVLATPLTVCVVVIGRHVDRLTFLDVLLGDAPPLTPVESFYQRMLVGEPSEIADHAESYLREHTLLDYSDHVAMKALLMAQIDVRRGVLDEKRQTRIRDTMRDLVEVIADQDDDPLPLDGEPDEAPASLDDGGAGAVEAPSVPIIPKAEIDPAWTRDKAVICVAGRTPLDEAAAHLLADLLNIYHVGTHVEPADSLISNQLSHLAEADPRLVILSFLDADLSIAQARFAVRRLRRRLPKVPIVAAFWMQEEDQARASDLCRDVKCDRCVSSLPEAIKLCLERAALPALSDGETGQRPAPATHAAQAASVTTLQLSNIS